MRPLRAIRTAARRAGAAAVSAVVIVATGGLLPIPGPVPDDKTTTAPRGPR